MVNRIFQMMLAYPSGSSGNILSVWRMTYEHCCLGTAILVLNISARDSTGKIVASISVLDVLATYQIRQMHTSNFQAFMLTSFL